MLIFEFLIILSINYLGIFLEKFFKLPTPGAVNGLIILFLLLSFHKLKIDRINKAGNFLVANIMITFLPPSVKFLEIFHVIKNDILKILLLIVLSTIITMIVTGISVEYMIRRNEK